MNSSLSQRSAMPFVFAKMSYIYTVAWAATAQLPDNFTGCGYNSCVSAEATATAPCVGLGSQVISLQPSFSFLSSLFKLAVHVKQLSQCEQSCSSVIFTSQLSSSFVSCVLET